MERRTGITGHRPKRRGGGEEEEEEEEEEEDDDGDDDDKELSFMSHTRRPGSEHRPIRPHNNLISGVNNTYFLTAVIKSGHCNTQCFHSNVRK